MQSLIGFKPTWLLGKSVMKTGVQVAADTI